MVYYRFAWCFWVSSCKIHCATGSTFPHSLALKKTILMRSVLASSRGFFIEYTHNLLP